MPCTRDRLQNLAMKYIYIVLKGGSERSHMYDMALGGDPHTQQFTHKIEMVQTRAARWTMNDYARTTSVTSLLHQLGWQTLEERRSVARLCLFYKIVNGLLAVSLPEYIQPTHKISRYCHSIAFRQIHTGKD